MRGQGKKTKRLLSASIGILSEIQPCSVRAVCYRLFMADLIPNMSKSSSNVVSRVLTKGREEGHLPWSWVVDESRQAESVSTWDNTDELIEAAVDGYRRNYWQDQPSRVEVWSEKGTIRGTLAPVLNKYGVTFRVMHGYASATVVNDIAELSIESDKPLHALYVGDWDPSGKHMSDVDLPNRLREYGADLYLRRIALLREDLRGLPYFDVETKRSDPRYRWFVTHVRGRCYELDAFSPPELRKRVEQEIRKLVDRRKWNAAIAVEKVEVASMRQFSKQWQKLTSSK
jgi:hypothetical protein